MIAIPREGLKQNLYYSRFATRRGLNDCYPA